MDFANRGNRPQQQAAPAQTTMNGPESPTPMPTKKKRVGINFGKFGAMVVLFGVAILAAALVVALVFGTNEQKSESELVKTDKYQAVFLDSPDGQVYFGKLGVYNDDLYVLNDIFYVRVEQPIQPEGQNQQTQPNISLAKLGNELHGPEDVMFIARDKVLYWENLKDDGQVVSAITEFKANGEQAPATQPGADQGGAAPAAGTQPAGTPQQNDTPAEGADEEAPDTTTP
jgi:hypothetical protein